MEINENKTTDTQVTFTKYRFFEVKDLEKAYNLGWEIIRTYPHIGTFGEKLYLHKMEIEESLKYSSSSTDPQ